MMKHILFVTAALLLNGCASKSTTSKENNPAINQVVTSTPKMWRLTFDKRLEQNDFAAPILNLVFGSETLPFLVNTSSTSHSIDQWAADALKLTPANNIISTDFKIYSQALPLANFQVTKMNPRYEENGVAGFISPQLLITENAIALDFLNSKVFQDKFDNLVGQYNVKDSKIDACLKQGPEGASLYIVPVKINGSDLNMLVDSSAEDTTIKQSHPLAKSLLKDGNGKLFKLHKVKVSITGKTVTRLIDIKELPSLPCKADGLLGMDVLKLCVLIMDKNQLAVNCQTH